LDLKNYLFLRGAWSALFATLAIVLLAPSPARAVPMYALNTQGTLLYFETDSGVLLKSLSITGLQPGTTMVSIAFRPKTRQLYGIGRDSRLYIINTSTGAATQVGNGPFVPGLSADSFGFTFDPVTDRMRVLSETGENLLVNPDTGAVITVFDKPAYIPGDMRAGTVRLEFGGLAYRNNFPSPNTTTLYALDTEQYVSQSTYLVEFVPAESGKIKTVGRVGSTADRAGQAISAFAISPDGKTAYLSHAYYTYDFIDIYALWSLNLANLNPPRSVPYQYSIGGGIFRSLAYDITTAPNPTPGPTPNPQGPTLVPDGDSAQAVALDSVTMLRDPLPAAPAPDFSSDGRSRVMLFARNVELRAGEDASIITAQAEDSQHRIYSLEIEFVGTVPDIPSLTQINIRLPEGIASIGDVWLSISVRGLQSNKALVRIRPPGPLSFLFALPLTNNENSAYRLLRFGQLDT